MLAASAGARIPHGSADPFGPYVLLLLHMDGADNGTLFPDDSGTNKTITRLGAPGAVTSTDQVKFGESVGLFQDAGTDILAILTPSEAVQFAFLTGDFTIEMWVYRTSEPTNSVLFRWGNTNSHHPYSLYINNSGGPEPRFNFYGWDSSDTLAYQLFSTTSVLLDTWYFVQARRSGDTMALAVNGVEEASHVLSPITTLWDNAGTKAGIGDYLDGSGVRFHGYMDEVRVTRAARPFALQTQIFPNP